MSSSCPNACAASAIDAAVTTNAGVGDAVLATREIYGGTYALFENDFKKRGIAVEYVDQSDPVAVAAALERLRPNRLLRAGCVGKTSDGANR